MMRKRILVDFDNTKSWTDIIEIITDRCCFDWIWSAWSMSYTIVLCGPGCESHPETNEIIWACKVTSCLFRMSSSRYHINLFFIQGKLTIYIKLWEKINFFLKGHLWKIYFLNIFFSRKNISKYFKKGRRMTHGQQCSYYIPFGWSRWPSKWWIIKKSECCRIYLYAISAR